MKSQGGEGIDNTFIGADVLMRALNPLLLPSVEARYYHGKLSLIHRSGSDVFSPEFETLACD